MQNKLKKMLRMGAKKKSVSTFVGTASYGGNIGNPFACYETGSYDNNFASINRIAEAFCEVLPYAVDAKGEGLKETPQLVKALYSPNREMSGVKFFETLITMALVHPTVYILCWRKEGRYKYPGGNITPQNIAGFTFLENPSVMYQNDDTIKYRIASQIFTDSEVIAISLNVNPYSLTAGYSPSLAAKKWATVDDYVVDYHAGFFKNGAVPEGQFVITARTPEEFNEIVDFLERQHRGAGNTGKVNYVHRTMTDDGKAGAAQIEWIPYATPSKDMALTDIFNQSNKKTDMAFGVPQEVKGYIENSNYASAEVADYIFARRSVYPKLVKIWAEFTHEMNRITGGLGFAISFDFELPTLSDEEKVRAEAKQISVNSLLSLVNNGFSVESAVRALDLPESYLDLEREIKQAEETYTAAEENGNDDVSQLETSQKSVHICGCNHKAKLYEANTRIEAEVRDYTRKQVKAAMDRIEFNNEEEAALFADRLWQAIEPVIQSFGAKQWVEAGGMDYQNIGFILQDLEYQISDKLRETYAEYLSKVSLSYTEDTAISIKRVLEQADVGQWDNEKLRDRLENIMDTDDWRIQRLARTESQRAEQSGRLDAMISVQKETGVEFGKIWNVNPGTTNHCQECLDLDGKQFPLEKEFGEFSVGMNEIASAHPNCACYLTYVIVKYAEEKSVKVECPACGRYICESKGGEMRGVICANSHCKKHWNIKVIKGNINAEEAEKKG